MCGLSADMDMSEGGIRLAEYRPCVCSLSADMGRREGGIRCAEYRPCFCSLSADMDRNEGGIKGGLSIDPVSVQTWTRVTEG